MARSCSVLLVWLLCAAGVSTQDPQRPSDDLDFRGDWRLNQALSDELPLLPGEAVALARASGALPSRARVARATRGPDPRRLTGVRQLIRAELAAEFLTIVHSGRDVTLTFEDAGPLSVVADGRKVTLEREGLEFTLSAHWIPPLLTIEREYEDGTSFSQSFASFDDPRQLVATSTIENERTHDGPITFRRVFEIMAAEGDS